MRKKSKIRRNRAREDLFPYAPVTIARIEMQGLFGYFNYLLPSQTSPTKSLTRLMLLYGDNGSGKTTILQIVFHVLSAANDRGHRTVLASISFNRIIIHLSNGIAIVVQRPKNSHVGSYSLAMKNRRKTLAQFQFDVDGNLQRADKSPLTDKGLNNYVAYLSKMSLDLYFLTDSRDFVSDTFPREDQPNDEVRRDRIMRARERVAVLTRGPYLSPEALRSISELQDLERAEETSRTKTKTGAANLIELSISRLVRWIEYKALQGSNEGEANVNSIYADLVATLAKSAKHSIPVKTKSVDQICDALQELQMRSEKFAIFGLTKPLTTGEMIGLIRKIPPSRHEVVFNVLQPYINGIEARFDALQSLQDIILEFTKALNSLYSNKSVEFSMATGLQIVARNGFRLSPSMLSSGERQLMLLMCNVIMARDRSSIFIIDEPELSLNVKWQRALVDLLLECTKDGQIQFLIATHSIELLTQHQANVVDLIEVGTKI